MNMNFKRKLPIPMDIKAQFPLSEQMKAQKAENDAEIKKVFTGESEKLLLIIGPCSADAKEPVLDYISRLAEIREKVKDKIVIVPRIYTGKPRTTGEGYMGMLHQPDPSESPDVLQGIIAMRDIHMCALKEYGFSCADEMLYPANYRYLSDILSYIAVGARSVENQEHRLVSSGLDIPVGMKNPTSGDVSIMLNSITAAQKSHTFIYRGWEVESEGNPLAHAILRGAISKDGISVSNYHYDNILNLSEMYQEAGLKNPGCIVDTNHSNSGKNYLEQINIVKDVLRSREKNNDVKKLIKGFMIESYIEDGAGTIENRLYGQSITDPCLGWKKTEQLIFDIAEQV